MEKKPPEFGGKPGEVQGWIVDRQNQLVWSIKNALILAKDSDEFNEFTIQEYWFTARKIDMEPETKNSPSRDY